MSENIDRVRRKILQTAKELMVKQGYKKTTIRQIVSESGVTSGSIYHLFPSKEKIFQAIVNDLMDRVVAIADESFQDKDPALRYAAILEIELVAIQDPTDNWVDIKVPETELSQYALNQEVTLIGRDDKTKVTGIITDISKKADFAATRAMSERGKDTDIITFNVKV